MDQIGVTLLEDGFETNFDKWTDYGATNWDMSNSQQYSGTYSAHAGDNDDDLISDTINTSSYSSFTIDFWYRDDDIDDGDNIYLQLRDGSGYDNYFELGNSAEDTWNHYTVTITDAQYLHANFRIKFEGTSIDNGENLWIDDVLITAGGVSGGAGYVRQSAAGDSGATTFALTASQEARMLTIAIAPNHDTRDDCCGSQILP